MRHQVWQIDVEGFGSPAAPPATLLKALDKLETPETIQRMKPFPDVYEVLVLDGWGRDGEGSGKSANSYLGRSYEQFEAVVASLVLQVCGCDNVKGALALGEQECIRNGDLEQLTSAPANASAKQSAAKNKGKLSTSKGDGAAAMLESLRDDDLAFKLSRSLFR